MSARVRLKRDLQTAIPKSRNGPAGLLDWHSAIPFAVNDQDPERPAIFDPAQRAEPARKPAVDGNHAGEPFWVRHGDPIRHRSAFADSNKEDSLGVNMQGATGPANGSKDSIFQAVNRVRLGGGHPAAKHLGVSGGLGD